MRSTPRALLTISLCGVALALAGCSAEPTSEPTSEATAPASSEPTEGATDGTLTDGSQEVEIESYAGTYLAPTVEGGLALVEDPAAAEVPAQWIIGPVEAGGDDFQLVTVALTDGEPSCLTLSDGGDPSLAGCDVTDASQVFGVTTLDRPEQVSISNEAGVLAVDAESGSLTVHPDGADVSSTFTLAAS